MAVELSFPYSLKDRLRATIVLGGSTPSSVLFQRVAPLLGIAFIVAAGADVLPRSAERFIPIAILASILPVCVLLGAALVYLLSPTRRESFRYVIDDAGVHVHAQSQSFTHYWSTISKAEIRGGLFMLFFRPGCAHCLPLSAIKASGQFDALVDQVRSQGKPVTMPS